MFTSSKRVNGKWAFKLKDTFEATLVKNLGSPITLAGPQEISITSTPWTTDKFFVPVTSAFTSMASYYVRPKSVYTQVCINLGATPSDAQRGYAPCPYKTGTYEQRLMNMEGRIRSWIEERSPHSRQHYFCAGKRASWKPNSRPLLFLNPVLGKANKDAAWAPYTYARGGGWAYDPEQAKKEIKPSEDILNAAAALYKKKGMRGQGRKVFKANVSMMTVNYVATGSVFVPSA
jgi:hypothetical protein